MSDPQALPADSSSAVMPHRPRRGDDVEAWLVRERDRLRRHPAEAPSREWIALVRLVDRYRECADHGLTLRPEDHHRGDP